MLYACQTKRKAKQIINPDEGGQILFSGVDEHREVKLQVN